MRLGLNRQGVISGAGEAPYEVSAIKVETPNNLGGFHQTNGSGDWLSGVSLNDGFTYHCMFRMGAHANSYSQGVLLAFGEYSSSFIIKHNTSSWNSYLNVYIRDTNGVYVLNSAWSAANPQATANYYAGMTMSWNRATAQFDWWFSYHDKAELSRSQATAASTNFVFPADMYIPFHGSALGLDNTQPFGWGAIFHEFFDNQYVDLSVAANRRKFCGDQAEWGVVNPGADGSGFLGTQPLFFSHNGDPRENVGSLTVDPYTANNPVVADTSNLPPVLG